MAEVEVSERRGMKMMLAFDESECSHYALDWTLDNLLGTISSPLIVFTVQSISTLSFIPAASYSYASSHSFFAQSPGPELVKAIKEHQKKICMSIMEHAKRACMEKGVSVETITEVGDPKEVICEAVEKLKIDLLILGSHGRGALQRAFLGSVSNYCVQNAKCPVLVVKKAV